MKKKDRAIMDMADALDAELKDDSAIYEGNLQFEEGVATFRANKLVAEAALLAAYPEDQKFSTDKLAAKIALSVRLSILCGLAFVALKKLGKLSLAKTLYTKPSKYTHLPDTDFATLAEAMHKIMFDNMGLINIPSLTTEVLAEILQQIADFKKLQGTSLKVRKNSPILTKAYEATLPPLKDSAKDLQKLVGFYFETKPDFYARVMATSTVPTVHYFHTYIIITAILKSTGKPAPGITFTLAKANKIATTDRDGMASMKYVTSGEDVLIGTFNGKEVYNAKVSIKRSTTNHWEVVIEGM